MSNLQLWFNKAFEAGKSVQKREHKGETVDGRAVWGEIESKISDLKDKNLTNDSGVNLMYNSELNDLYDEMDVIIKNFDMDESEFNPKSNHFFMQLKNLVKGKSNFVIQLNRVAQLGFNAGQLSIFLKKGTLGEDRREMIKKLVKDNKMLELDTYVSPDVQSTINRKYLDGTKFDLTKGVGGGIRAGISVGGGDIYYVKYMKYKSKYMKYKSNNK
jgi:hypothetical protein